MRIHVVSDDTFFFLGCDAILTNNGHSVNRIELEIFFHYQLTEEIKKGDITMVAIANHATTQKVLIHLSLIGTKIILFINTLNGRYKPSSWLGEAFSKNTKISLLIPILESTNNYEFIERKPLTKREVEIMQKILHGMSFKKISVLFNISVKTVYAHRQNALKKIGLHHPIGVSYAGYQNYMTLQTMRA